MISGAFGEMVDALLVDPQPMRDAELRADVIAQGRHRQCFHVALVQSVPEAPPEGR